MRYANVEITTLIPIQGFLERAALKECMQKGNDSRSIPVVQYGNKYITCDGHHRTTIKLINGKRKNGVAILESDEDVSADLRGIFTYGLFGSIESVIGEYEEFWKQRLKRRGIASFNDYLEIYAKTIAKLNAELRTQ